MWGSYTSACVLSSFSYAWLCTALWTVAHQAPLSMGFSRQAYWSELPCPPPEDLPTPGIKPESLLCLLHWQAGSLPLAPPGKPLYTQHYCQMSSSIQKTKRVPHPTKPQGLRENVWLSKAISLPIKLWASGQTPINSSTHSEPTAVPICDLCWLQ